MKTFLPLLFLLLFYNNLFSQTPCGVGTDEPPGCLMCTNTYSGSTAGYTQGQPGPTFPCGSVENNLWLAFIANSSNVTIILSVGTCVQGQGLDMMVYDQNLVPVLNCFSNGGPGPGQTASAGMSGLIPGEIYSIMVDGFAGDICDFTITGVGFAVGAPPINTPEITGPSRVCPGDIATYSLATSLPGDVTYNWTVPSGTSILSGQGTEEITVKFNSSGTGIIQATHDYPCVSGIPAPPFAVDYLPIPPTYLPPDFYCREDFPVVIDGNQFNQPGNYSLSLPSFHGCDSLVTYNLLSYPNTSEFLNETICIGDTFYLNNEPYFETGSYRQVFENAAVSGCDSSIELSLTVVDPSITIDQPDNLVCLPNATVTLNVTGINLPNTGVIYQWTASNGGNIISGADTPQPVVDAAGTYTVLVEATIIICLALNKLL
jgi:hypothetical protein